MGLGQGRADVGVIANTGRMPLPDVGVITDTDPWPLSTKERTESWINN